MIPQYAQMQTPGGTLQQYPWGNVQNQQGASSLSPLFGRPGWTYVKADPAPIKGPTPHLAQGSGRTAKGPFALPGNSPSLPGYLVDNEYYPTENAYQPPYEPSFRSPIPRSIQVGNDGIDLLGTYRAHDFTPADRFFNQFRKAAYWQVQEYPPNYRNLLAYQQVRRYQVASRTEQPRVLDPSNYFLGYQINPLVQASLGQSTLGSMGSQ